MAICKKMCTFLWVVSVTQKLVKMHHYPLVCLPTLLNSA